MKLRWSMIGLTVGLFVVAAPAARAGGGGGGHCDAFSSGQTITMLDSCFTGTAHFAEVGSLEVLNEGTQPHNLTLVGADLATATLVEAGSETLTLSEPGIFRFYCTLHGTETGGGMAGVLIVGDPATDTALGDLDLVAAAAGDAAGGAGPGGDGSSGDGSSGVGTFGVAAAAAVGAAVGGGGMWLAVRRGQIRQEVRYS